MRRVIAMLLCRLLRFAARVTHRGGTAMPGRIALKIDPSLLRTLASGVSVVCVTGTNGKTTCCRMLEQCFSEAGLDPLANRSGANLISGVTTEFVMNSSLSGRCRKKFAVIECDEAAARRVFPELQPKLIVVTNLFRDQLDRYGEVTHTLENIREGIRGVPSAVLCLNADCSLTSSLAGDLPNAHVFYGLEPGAVPSAPLPEISDALHCLRCKTRYEYDFVSYGHLGRFRCPRCGYCRPEADVAVLSASFGADESRIRIRTPSGECEAEVNLPAVYNVYNALAAFTAAREAGLPESAVLQALRTFRCGFGRMEKFALGQKGARMLLVKNPAGCNQALQYLESVREPYVLLACLNDRGADGTDISWIWDADFELLLSALPERIVVSGDRASDLFLRLKYAGVPPERITLERDYESIISSFERSELPLVLMTTYTAMLELRSVVVKHCGGTDFWEG